MEAIESFHGKKTLVIIAHRLRTIAGCDIIYKVDVYKRQGKDKLVIAPEKWMNGRGCCDIYTDEMIRV